MFVLFQMLIKIGLNLNWIRIFSDGNVQQISFSTSEELFDDQKGKYLYLTSRSSKVKYYSLRVPIWTGKPGKMGRHFPVREK